MPIWIIYADIRNFQIPVHVLEELSLLYRSEHLTVGTFLLELARDASKRATSSGADDEHVHVTVTCL